MVVTRQQAKLIANTLVQAKTKKKKKSKKSKVTIKKARKQTKVAEDDVWSTVSSELPTLPDEHIYVNARRQKLQDFYNCIGVSDPGSVVVSAPPSSTPLSGEPFETVGSGVIGIIDTLTEFTDDDDVVSSVAV